MNLWYARPFFLEGVKAMKRIIIINYSLLIILFITVTALFHLIPSCGGGGGNGSPSNPTWDVDTKGIPKFVNSIYIDLSQKNPDGTPLIYRISKFRSSVGHDYTASYESCRSMKHYFSSPNSETKLFAPVSGTVVWRDVPIGADINIASDQYPAFVFTIMHPVLFKAYKVGDHLTEGELIGYHVGSWTSSDIIVNVNDGKFTPDPARLNGHLISYFETLTDTAFKTFRDRGINAPSDLIITQEQRDAVPIPCLQNGAFDPTWIDPLPQWVNF